MQLDYEYIKVERDAGVVSITLNKPEQLNPWLIPMMEEMTVEMDKIANDPDDKVVVFTGAGRAFSSGGDVRAMGGVQRPIPIWMHEGPNGERGLWNAPTMTSEERMLNKTLSGTRIHKQVFNLDKPTIAAVNGIAAGAGCDLAMTCDIRIASELAGFCEVYIRRALIPLDGGAFWAPYHLPMGRAMEMLLTGDVMDAQEAYRLGLVNKVVPPDQLMAVTMELAHRLAKGPSISQALIKHMVRKIHMEQGFAMTWDLAAKAGPVVRETKDYEEGVKSFLEKRAPEFKGR